YLCEGKIPTEQSGDQGRLGWITAYMAVHFWSSHDPEHALGHGNRALAMAQAGGDFALQVIVNLHLGQVYLSLGDYPRARECFQRNIESVEGDLVHERFGEAGLLSVLSRVWLVQVLIERGEFAEASARAEEAVRIAETVNHPYSLVGAYCGLGQLYLSRGDLEEAVSVLERSHRLCQAWNIPTFKWGVASFLGYAYVLTGRLAD